MKFFRILALAALGLAVVALAGAARPESASGLAAQLRADGITVNGTGAVRAVPDRADFSFGVQSTGRTASAALDANSAEMRKVIAALREAGVAAADIQTQQVALSPRLADNGETILGYIAQNTVSAHLRDLGRAGAVIDAAVGAGANQVFGPSLSRSNEAELYRNALRSSVADARTKAQAIAAAAGVTLGAVIGVTETGGAPVPIEGKAGAATDATPIEPGTQDIQASVTVTFAVA
ncbi:MAG: SIMPL domain-containing protein [Thermoleophilia bacterium]